MKRALNLPKACLDLLALQVVKAGGLARMGPIELNSARRVILAQAGLSTCGVVMIRFFGYASSRLWVNFVVIAIGTYAPVRQLQVASKRRKQIILWELPDLMEIVAMIMEAGLSFDAAVKYIADRKQGYVAGLFQRARNEIDAGVKRETAYGRIAKLGSNELSMFLDSVIKAEAQGRPVKKLVLDMSRAYRDRQKNMVEEAANKLPTTMLIPIFIFIVPPMILIYLLPAIQSMGLLFR
jgi:tight adherence protein C